MVLESKSVPTLESKSPIPEPLSDPAMVRVSIEAFQRYCTQNIEALKKVHVKEFWSSPSPIFSPLRSVAQMLLAIPATSASSERVFSTSGHIITKYRCSLKGSTASKLVLIHDNKTLLSKHPDLVCGM